MARARSSMTNPARHISPAVVPSDERIPAFLLPESSWVWQPAEEVPANNIDGRFEICLRCRCQRRLETRRLLMLADIQPASFQYPGDFAVDRHHVRHVTGADRVDHNIKQVSRRVGTSRPSTPQWFATEGSRFRATVWSSASIVGLISTTVTSAPAAAYRGP